MMPADSYGRPLIGREDWVRQPGDQPAGAVGELEGDAVAGFGGDETVDDTAIA